MRENKQDMIIELKRRGWINLKVKIGSYLYKKYGANCPVEHCPEYQIRAVHKKGTHYVPVRQKEKEQGQLKFTF